MTFKLSEITDSARPVRNPAKGEAYVSVAELPVPLVLTKLDDAGVKVQIIDPAEIASRAWDAENKSMLRLTLARRNSDNVVQRAAVHSKPFLKGVPAERLAAIKSAIGAAIATILFTGHEIEENEASALPVIEEKSNIVTGLN